MTTITLADVDTDTPPAKPNSYCVTCDMAVSEPGQADYHRAFEHEVWQAD